MRKKRKPLRIVQKPMDYIGKLCLIVVGYNYQGVVEHSRAHGSVFGGCFAQYVYLGEITAVTFTDNGGIVEFDSIAAKRGEWRAMVSYWQTTDIGMQSIPFGAEEILLKPYRGQYNLSACNIVSSRHRLSDLLLKRVHHGNYLLDEFLQSFNEVQLLRYALDE